MSVKISKSDEPDEKDVSLDPETQSENDDSEVTEIESWSDIGKAANDGIDKLMNSSSDELKDEALRLGNKAFRWWKRVTGD